MKTIVVLVTCSAFALCQTNNAPAFYIKGQRLAIGMSQTEVATTLSERSQRVDAARNSVEYSAAVEGMLSELGDPATHAGYSGAGAGSGKFLVIGGTAAHTTPEVHHEQFP